MRKFKTALLVLTFPILSGCILQNKTRKPNSDLETQTKRIYRIDDQVVVEELLIEKLDTALNLFKGEALIGITVKGAINVDSDSELDIKYYIEKLDFIEKPGSSAEPISIELIPFLKSINSTAKRPKPPKNDVKYKRLAGKTEFEFDVEKRITQLNFGKNKIDITCGQIQETVLLWRPK
jgi:hypothetical protein